MMKSFKNFLQNKKENNTENNIVHKNLFVSMHGSHAKITKDTKENTKKNIKEEESHQHYDDWASSEYRKNNPRERYKSLAGSQHESIENHPDRDALKGYTKSSYPLNKALFDRETSGKKLSAKHQAASEGLDRIISDHTLPEKHVVYHGAGFDPRKIQRNGIIRSPGYLSTTNNPEGAGDHARYINNETGETHDPVYDPESGSHTLPRGGNFTRHIIRIEVPAGTNAVAPGRHSKHPAENEILFGRNRNLRLTGETHEFHVQRREGGTVTTVVHHARME